MPDAVISVYKINDGPKKSTSSVRKVVNTLRIFLLSAFVMTSSNGQAQMHDIIRFEYAVKMPSLVTGPSLISGIGWFPDNNTLAVASGRLTRGESIKLRLVDANSRSISEPVVASGLPSRLTIVVSPDGALVLTLGSTLSLYSTNNWKLIAYEWRGKDTGCSITDTTRVQFTPDSKYIWVSCSPPLGGRVIAMKLQIPDLKSVQLINSAFDPVYMVFSTLSDDSDVVIEHNVAYGGSTETNTRMPASSRFFVSATSLTTGSVLMPPRDMTKDVGESAFISSHAAYLSP